MTPAQALTGLRLWWMGDFLGAVVVAPLILVWRRPPRGWFRGRRLPEMLALLALSFLCGQVVFLGWFADPLGPVALGYWSFLFIGWGALRFGRHGALLIVAMASVQGLLGAVWRVGFFAQDVAATQLANYWFYTLILCGTGLTLALLVEGWRTALQAARTAQQEARCLLEETEEARRGLVRVVEEQRATEADLRAERDLRRRYLDMVEAVIVALDRKGRITLVNRKACRLFGFTDEELRGRDWFRDCLAQPAGREEFQPLFAQMMDGRLEPLEVFENEVQTRTGERRLVAWRNRILLDDQGRPAGGLAAGEDITERRAAERRLQEQMAELHRWHRVTLGREQRILDLKEEINRLAAELGTAPRYPSAVQPGAADVRAAGTGLLRQAPGGAGTRAGVP